MKINNDSHKVMSLPDFYGSYIEAKKSFDEYLEQKQYKDLEIKEALIKVEEDMCQLKSLLAQIASIKCRKNVS
jgi:hypothetical protein